MVGFDAVGDQVVSPAAALGQLTADGLGHLAGAGQ
jgi:hypothetical protein